MTDFHEHPTNDVHALSGAYAVNALDAAERERFERHLDDCAACRSEVAELSATAAAIAESVAVEPPAGLRASVLEGIDAVRPLPPLVASPPAEPRRGLLARIPKMQLALAAAFLGIAVAGLALASPWQDQRPDVVTASDVLEAHDATRRTESLPGGATVTVTLAPSLDKAVITTDDLDPAPDGKVYELWLQKPGGGLDPAGFLPDAKDATVLVDGQAAEATAVGVTVEPDGGSAKPTTEPFIWVELA